MARTAIIIPCYNEAQRINQNKFIQYSNLNKNVFFVFVNDGSNDDTELLLQDLHEMKPDQTAVINLLRNSGKGEAVRQGFLSVSKDNFEYIGYWDADLSTPLSSISTFIQKLNDSIATDIIMGARVKLLGRSVIRLPLRHYLGRVFATFASMILGIPVYDTQCGAKLFRNSQIIKRIFAKPFMTKWSFDVEILARYIAMSNENIQQIVAEKIIEYPLESWMHVSGSKMRIIDYIRGGWGLVRIWHNYKKDLSRVN